MSNVINLDDKREKEIHKLFNCIICDEEIDGRIWAGKIPSGRQKNEYILIGSCNKCFHTIIKERMNDIEFWKWVYKERGIFENLPPLQNDEQTESG